MRPLYRWCIFKSIPISNPSLVTKKFCDTTFWPHASRPAQAEASGFRIAWPMVRSSYLPKFSFLSGTVSEVLANVTFVTGNHVLASRFALGACRSLQFRHSVAHASICLRAKIQPSKWSGLRDISNFVKSRLGLALRPRRKPRPLALAKHVP